MSKKKIKQLQLDVKQLQQLVLSASKTTTEEVWLDTADIKQLFNFSESKIYRLRKNQQIPNTILGGRYHYPKSFFTQTLLQKIKNKGNFI